MPRSPAPAAELLERFGGKVSVAAVNEGDRTVIALGWTEFDALLPDGGLPRGVIELRAARALGCATSVALAAVRAVHAGDEHAWCAWIDPDRTLYSPGIAMAGVDLRRLAVVRPARKDLFRIATKVVRSHAFAVVILDVDALPGASDAEKRARPRHAALDVVVRRLAVLAAEAGATVLLLTDASIAQPAPLPTALRLELSRTRHTIEARVAKERHGRIGLARTVPVDSRPGLILAS